MVRMWTLELELENVVVFFKIIILIIELFNILVNNGCQGVKKSCPVGPYLLIVYFIYVLIVLKKTP